jgi:L-amino acid N-acyltransferase YncA
MMDTVTTASDIEVRPLEPSDWPRVEAIYTAGIATGNATFETAAPPWPDWDSTHRPDLRYVATQNDQVVGWIAASNVSDRCCYAGVIEHSVYIHPDYIGKGIGKLLLSMLVDAAEAAGIWTIQSGIFPENSASIALHHACGFRTIGRRERLGQLRGTWRDVLLLEHRRSDPSVEPFLAERTLPIACTLDEPQAGQQLDRWSETLRRLVVRVERTQTRQLRLALAGDPEGIAALVALAKTEKGCCSFFDFRLDIGADTVTLVIEVPVGSETTLDIFACLATGG